MKTIVLAILCVMLIGAPLAQKSLAQKRRNKTTIHRSSGDPTSTRTMDLPLPCLPRLRPVTMVATAISTFTPSACKTGLSSTCAPVHKLMDCETTLADLWDKADANKNPKEPVIRGTLKQVELSGLRGLEYETGSSDQRSLHRFQCGDKIFYIISAGYKGKRPADVNRIINSFQVVNPAHQ